MITSKSYMLFATVAIAGMLAFPAAHAQSLDPLEEFRLNAAIDEMKSIPLIIETDSNTYAKGSVITVQGTVAHTKPSNQEVAITVISPVLRNVVGVAQVDVVDNAFMATFNTAGSDWRYDGTYIIKAQYGSTESNQVRVEFTGGQPVSPPVITPTECADNAFLLGDYCTAVDITGGTITSVDADSGEMANTLAIEIDAPTDGTLTVSPFKPACNDRSIVVLADAEELEDFASDGNMISIDFAAGTSMIEIVGPCVVPEFGTIAVLVLAAAIVSIIAVSSRSRFSIMPRY